MPHAKLVARDTAEKAVEGGNMFPLLFWPVQVAVPVDPSAQTAQLAAAADTTLPSTPAAHAVPEGHAAHGVAPPGEYIAAAQGAHALESAAPPPLVVSALPAAQGVHAEAPTLAAYVPRGHATQALTDVAPAAAPAVPAGHIVQTVALGDAPYVPGTHARHDEKPASEYVPVGHAWHPVAVSAVPAAHTVGAVVAVVVTCPHSFLPQQVREPSVPRTHVFSSLTAADATAGRPPGTRDSPHKLDPQQTRAPDAPLSPQ
jgi:hypothetical protein